MSIPTLPMTDIWDVGNRENPCTFVALTDLQHANGMRKSVSWLAVTGQHSNMRKTPDGDGRDRRLSAVASVLPPDTVQLVEGTSDKLYSAAEEAARNTDPGVANVLALTAYKIQNADLVGTLTAVTAQQPQPLQP